MIENISRTYLEIKSLKDLNEVRKPEGNYSIILVEPNDFQLNKFFYKQIGKKLNWVDRLDWSDDKWIKYLNDKNVSTYTLKEKNNLVGYYEQIINEEKLGISAKGGKGYRTLANISEHGGQEVPHLHFHLFGGEKVGKMVE